MKPSEWNLPYMPYFAHEALAHNFPPDWTPSEWGRDELAARQQATEQRERQQALGRPGTIVGLSEKSDARAKVTRAPEWMKP